ncbi:Aminodeoxychorismate lyase [Marinobacter litoralis]|uniref:Aminodeoxychorismate lyase n=1 Tax=Marinobacter litoralis TaxID=187981 RepID=A0A3M2RKU5_9GAMM|nr:aminodeoxychorismate lyase [Marinobacter litoralis]RMJ05966.1 Aminodeoxychorismate lyase [Marinobacter litoralis]
MIALYWAEDGRFPPGDRGLAYGDGLFETIRVDGGSAHLKAYHLDRMTRDAARLHIPVNRSELEHIFHQAVERYSVHYSVDSWILKLTLTRGSGGRGYRPSPNMKPNLLVSHAAMPPLAPASGVAVDFSRVPLTVNPLLAGIKSLNRIEQVMAASELQDGLFEVLMANPAGHIVEGTRTNLFIETDDGWRTPSPDSVAVRGVMRRYVIERLRANAEEVHEAPILLDDMLASSCRGVYLTNSVLGVVSVRTLAGQDLPVTGRLATICGSTPKTE